MCWLKRVAVWSLVGGALFAQAPAKSSDELKAEAAQAQVLYDKQDFLGALPLYEDLHAHQPESLIFQERLAMTLLSKAGQQDGAEAQVTRTRAKDLLVKAQAAGDNSNLVQILLEKLNSATPAGTRANEPAGAEWVKKGEAAFSSGDLQGAVELYEKALEVNPQYYAAALFAGDAEYKLKHTAEASKWFARAIAIDPDTETAYRYWGDCLEKAGEHKRAEEEFIAAIIAQPYQRAPRVGLKQWADANHSMVVAPPITLPRPAAKGSDGKINITIDASKKNSSETSLDMMYSMNSALWQGDKFKKEFPQEKAYRHSLKEEADSIRLMLTVAQENKIADSKLSTSTRLLRELDKNGMLECWILFDHADQGIAQDYVAYRKDHRALMERYIAQYDVHAM